MRGLNPKRGGPWVQLVELPSDVEYYDNIVAFWRPEAPLIAGRAYNFVYGLTWCDDVPLLPGYRIVKTRSGAGTKPGSVRFVIDFVPKAIPGLAERPSDGLPTAAVSASAGDVGDPLVQRNASSASG